MRLSYLNVTFKGLTFGAANPDELTDKELLEMYRDARSIAEQPIEIIVADATEEFGENVISLTREEGFFAEYTKVPIDALCFDDGHEFYGTLHGIQIRRGDLLTDYYDKHKNHPEIKESVKFIKKHKEFFNRYIPITVRPYGDGFEVSSGNHRVFAAIVSGDIKIPALVCTKQRPQYPQMNLDFTL